MLFRLSLKNLKKSIRDYSIYFFTLILGVSIFYLFNSIGAQTAMMELSKTKADSIDMLKTVISSMSVMVSFILGFLIVYASRFLIRKRKKEFGVYLTLGMRKGDISKILLAETAVIGALSLGVGLVIGILLSQFMSLFVAGMFEADMSRFVFVVSPEAVLKTILYFVIIYLVVIIMNTFIVARAKLIDLFNADRMQEKIKLKNPILCAVLFLAACVMLGTAYYNVTVNSETLQSEFEVIVQIVLGIVGTFLIFWSVSGFVLEMLKKVSGIYHRRLNSFILSETGAQINTAVVAGSVICLLLFVTICALSSAFALKSYREGRMEYLAPVSLCLDRETTDGKTEGEVLEEKGFDMAALDVGAEFCTYETDTVTEGTLLGSYMDHLKENGFSEEYAAQPVEIIRLSDYNRAARLYGFDPVSLGEDEYAISSDYPNTVDYYNEGLKVNDTIEIHGRTLTAAYGECVKGYIRMRYSESNMGLVIVPDDVEFAEGERYASLLIADYAEGYDTDEFRSYMDDGEFEALVSGREDEPVMYISTQSDIYDDSIGSSAMVIFIALYLGFVFIISGAAILALKEMSDAIDSRHKYEILRRLGVAEKEQDRALLIQMGIFFGFPLILAVIHSIFGIQVCSQMMMGAFSSADLGTTLGLTAGMIVVIYGGYFLVSYLCCRRVVHEKEQ